MKKWILALSILFSSVYADGELPYTVIEDKALVPIKTPAFKERKIAKIRLKNGLEAVLISDPNSDQSAASLSVKAGSWQDPDEYPGIAHFLEHMLFMGTEEFPNEAEYQKYISERNGNTNAFTTNDYTAYVFSINNDSFKGALERFSSFFKHPLFNPSGVGRELNAIDQEFAKNVENDDIRDIMVLKELSNPKHPNQRFVIGNSNTLAAVSQDTLKNWYKEHYSANLMKLYVVSVLPMNELIDTVVKDFSGINNTDKKAYTTATPISNDDLAGKIIYIQPIKNLRTLTLMFELPRKFAQMQNTRPDRLLTDILGYEGDGSLLSLLKKENLANKIGSDTYDIGDENLLLLIQMDLTDEGLTKLNDVLLYFFQTIALLKEQGIPKYLFDDFHKMETINYEYQARSDAYDSAFQAASVLVKEPTSTFPEKSYITKEFNEKDIKELIDFITPEHARFFVRAPQNLTGVKLDKKEKWFGVDYTLLPIDPHTLKKWATAALNPNIYLPKGNPFIPEKLEVHATEQKALDPLSLPKPEKILDNSHGLIYFAQDNQYLMPELYLYFDIKTPHVEMGRPFKSVIADLYVKAIEENLNSISYPAKLGGLKFDVNRSNFGISFLITGYSENAPKLFDEILNELKNNKVTEKQFDLYKELLLRDYQNFSKESPMRRAQELLRQCLYKNFSTNQQKAIALKKLNFEKFLEMKDELLKNTYVEGLIFGNVTKNEAEDYTSKLLKKLDSQPYPKKDQKELQVVNLSQAEGPFILENKIPAQGNALFLAVEYPDYSFKKRAAQQIFMQAIKAPFFNELRTNQQTGYIVFAADQNIQDHLFNFFAIQSNTHDPRDLLARIELFIETYVRDLGTTNISKEEFEEIRQALLVDLKKPQNNMDDLGNLLRTIAFTQKGDFEIQKKRIEAMEKLTYEDFIELSKEVMGKSNKRRFAVFAKGGDDGRVLQFKKLNDVQQLKKLNTYSE